MNHFSLLLIMFSVILIILILLKQHQEKKKFEQRIQQLENLLLDLNSNLTTLNYKVKLIDDVKVSIKKSNSELNNAVKDLNFDLFKQLYPNK